MRRICNFVALICIGIAAVGSGGKLYAVEVDRMPRVPKSPGERPGTRNILVVSLRNPATEQFGESNGSGVRMVNITVESEDDCVLLEGNNLDITEQKYVSVCGTNGAKGILAVRGKQNEYTRIPFQIPRNGEVALAQGPERPSKQSTSGEKRGRSF
jgi:hypothetical protein